MNMLTKPSAHTVRGIAGTATARSASGEFTVGKVADASGAGYDVDGGHE